MAHYRLREVGTLNKGIKLDLPGNLTLIAGLTTLLLGATLAALNPTLMAIGLIIGGVFFFLSYSRY